MRTFRFLAAVFLSIPLAAFSAPLPVVAIQPFGKVRAEDVAAVKAGIAGLYAVSVKVLPEMPLPKSAHYAPRDRYKADKILDALDAEAHAGITKVIALTASDISTKKGEIPDWGIFGLGQLGGKSCVVSTFRLRAGKAGDELFRQRLVKVVNHELGHTFGLEHCPAAACLMLDAGGKIATVDGESGMPCAACAARLPMGN